MTELLLSLPGIEAEAVNSSGMTSTDILMQRLTSDERDFEIQDSLRRAGTTGFHQTKHNMNTNKKNPKKKKKEIKNKNQGDWLGRQRSALMVVASLIATMAFQFAVTPPESLWNSDGSSSLAPDDRKVVMYYVRRVGDYLKGGEQFYTVNTASFIASLSIILLLMSGLPLNHRVFVWLLMIITWVAISGLALSYTVAVILQTPTSEEEKYMYPMFAITVFAWICLVSLLLIGHTIRLFIRMLKMFVRMIKLIIRSLSPRKRRRPPSATAQV